MTPPAGKKYLDAKILDKITRLDVRARLVVEGFITGMHKSPYHGFAVEFASHREYTPGDDLKHVDWKVWSRTDRWYIKEYEEETNLKCTILLDCSKSMRYGEHAADRTSKFDYAATAAACLAFMLQRQQDAVGLVTFDTDVRVNLPPSTHPNHLKLLVHELEKTQPDSHTDVGQVFRRLAEQIGRRGLVVLLSDLFVDLETLRRSLERFRHRRHEVVVFHVLHADELTFPFQDNTKFRGLEIADELLVEPRALRTGYLEALDRFRDQVRKACAAAGIDYVLLDTSQPLDVALSAYLTFRQRTQRAARGARRR